MKAVIAVALLAFVAIVYSQDKITPIRCPPVNGENATLLPNPFNCNHYFVCETGVPIAMKCPPGLHFNAKELACDWPWRAKCKEISH